MVAIRYLRLVLGWKPLVAMTLVLILSLVFIPGTRPEGTRHDFVELLPRFTQVP